MASGGPDQPGESSLSEHLTSKDLNLLNLMYFVL